MNGNAPKCSNTGSHSLENQKCQPNACRESTQLTHSSFIKRDAIRITKEANTSVTICTTSSPETSRRRMERTVHGDGALPIALALESILYRISEICFFSISTTALGSWA